MIFVSSEEKFEFLISNQKIVFQKREKDIYIDFYVNNGTKWIKSLSTPIISFEWGIYSVLTLQKVETSNHSFKVYLSKKIAHDMEINAIIESYPDINPWIHFKIEILPLKKLIFQKEAPEILLPILNFKQSIVINQPTKHTPPTNEWKSNDLPASYHWDSKNKIETCFFVDFSQMKWMSPKTFERFSLYECGHQSSGKFGLLNRIPLPSQVGIQKHFSLLYDFYITQNYSDKPIDKWNAVESLISHCFRLIPGVVKFPKFNLSWTDYSKGCIKDLMKENYCWFDPKNPKYYAYVLDESEIERRRAWESRHVVETMTMLDILPPWILYLKLHYDEKQVQHVRKTCQSILHFSDPESKFLYNNLKKTTSNEYEIIKPTNLSIGDSWYFFEPIARFGFMLKLLPFVLQNTELKQYSDIFRVMSEKSQVFVKKHNYRISAFYNPISLQPFSENSEEIITKLVERRGKKDINWKIIAQNYACLCIFIYIQIKAYYIYKETKFLEEAEKGAYELAKILPDELFWEPLEIAYGIAGLSELYQITHKLFFLEFAKKLILNELRMFYWYNDNSFDWEGKRNNLGLVMACIGIRYPAMKENIESIYPWLSFLKTAIKNEQFDIIPLEILKFFNLIRINSFYYFSEVLSKDLIYPSRVKTPCPYIPFEDLEMLETPSHCSKTQPKVQKGKRTGTLGREIYGAGETLWLYLMFEALAVADKSDIMILNIDLFDFNFNDDFPPKKPTFIIFNPYKKQIETVITFPHLDMEKQIETVISILSINKYSNLSPPSKFIMFENKISIKLKEEEVIILNF